MVTRRQRPPETKQPMIAETVRLESGADCSGPDCDCSCCLSESGSRPRRQGTRHGLWQVIVAGHHAALAGSSMEAYALAIALSSHRSGANRDIAAEVEPVEDDGCDPLPRFS